MDLDIVRVVRSIPEEHEKAELARLMSPFGEAVEANAPVAEHPRPSFARNDVFSLNGTWGCAFVGAADAASAWRTAEAPAQDASWTNIVVPFSPETRLSGVGRQLQPDELLWYRREFTPPLPVADKRLLLHFDGVDFACTVYVNGVRAGEHEGAYLPFALEITDLLTDGINELALCVWDPSETGTQLRGKQRLDRGDMWYTAQSGIWQGVWLEYVPEVHLASARILPDADAGTLGVVAEIAAPGEAKLPEFTVEIWDAATFDGDADAQDEAVLIARDTVTPEAEEPAVLSLPIPKPQLWSPDDPHLYRITLTFGDDLVRSYCAFRTVGVEADAHGTRRFCLNHRPLFLRGLLDQGYWPESLLTPPSEEAMEFDIRIAREAGFNLLRKHIKLESDRWYYLCDKLGMLVWQDMPSGGSELDTRLTRDIPTLFRRSWAAHRDDTPRDRAALAAGDATYRSEWLRTCEDAVERLSVHPCIVGWTLFNESWGQFDSAQVAELVHTLDPTRPVLAASGWYDQGAGDIQGIHNYFRGMHLFPDPYSRRVAERGLVPGGHPTSAAQRWPFGANPLSATNGNSARAQLLSEFGGLTLRIDGHSCLGRTYGYNDFTDPATWRAALDELLAQVDALEEQGLSGFVYTQLTDVEEETNGLLTYDRRVNKLRLGA